MTGLRLAMPLVIRRGAGLGNEMMPWAMAFIAAQALDLTLMHPAWGVNPREYWRYFGTSRLDWPAYLALRTVLPVHRFEEADYRAAGSDDLFAAFRQFGERRGLDRKRMFILATSGMWCGFAPLAGARPFLLGQLLSSRGAAGNLFDLDRRLPQDRARIGMHIRRGDFGPPPTEFAGRFNVAIPLEWYVRVARALDAMLGGRATFVVVSNASAEELAPLTSAVDCVTTYHQDQRDVSDMLALAATDFLVCSISSFSMWSAFFSESRYAWYTPQLTWNGDLGSIWGHQNEQQAPGSETVRAAGRVRATLATDAAISERGVAIGDDGSVPDDVIADIERRVALRRQEHDLVAFGSVLRRG